MYERFLIVKFLKVFSLYIDTNETFMNSHEKFQLISYNIAENL